MSYADVWTPELLMAFLIFIYIFFLSLKWASLDLRIGKAAIYSGKKTEFPLVFSLPYLCH